VTEPVVPVANAAPVAPTAPLPLPLPNLPVLTLPPGLVPSPAPVQGTVVAADPKTQNVTIATPQGNVAVQVSAQMFTQLAEILVPGTPVTVTLSTQGSTVTAQIAPAKRRDVATTTQPLEVPDDLPPPPPPLRAGQVFTALKLPEAEAPIAPAPRLAPDVLTRLPLPPDVREEAALHPEKLPDLLRALPQAPLRAFMAEAAKVLPKEQFARLEHAVFHPPAPAPSPALPEAEAETGILSFIRAVFPFARAPVPQAPPAPEAARAAQATLVNMMEARPPPEHAAAAPFRAGNKIPDEILFRINLLRVDPPGKEPLPAPTPPPAPGMAVEEGEVESVTSAGLPVIRAEGRHFVLQSPATAEPGTRVAFTAQPAVSSAPKPTIGAPVTEEPDLFLPAAWPELEEAILAAPPALAAAVRNTLPMPTAALPAAALLFLAALRTGDVENWLGPDTVRGLRSAGKKDLAGKLVSGFSRLAEQSQAPLPGGWKEIPVPLFHEGQVERLRFLVRRQEDETNEGGGAERGGKSTRFVLNLSFSNLGAMQLDGLIRRRQFDMILRTETALAPGAKRDLMQGFAAGLAQSGFEGMLGFQENKRGWVAPPAGETREMTA
jgi:hypothetical protein